MSVIEMCLARLRAVVQAVVAGPMKEECRPESDSWPGREYVDVLPEWSAFHRELGARAETIRQGLENAWRDEVIAAREARDAADEDVARLREASEGLVGRIDSFGGTFFPAELNASIDAIRAALAPAKEAP